MGSPKPFASLLVVQDESQINALPKEGAYIKSTFA